MPWDLALLLLLLGVLVPWRGAVRMKELLRLPQISTTDRLGVYASTIAAQWVVTGVTLWRAADRGYDASQLALAVPDAGFVLLAALLLTAFLLGYQLLSLRRLARLPPERQGYIGILARKIMPQNLTESLAFVALACTVAACEEALYRGFVYAVFEKISGGAMGAGIAASAIFFSVAHAYQGRRGLLATFLAGLLFAGVRGATGSIAPCVVAHLVADLAAGILAPRWLRGTDAGAHV